MIGFMARGSLIAAGICALALLVAAPSAPAATPYDEARSLLQHAVFLEGQAGDQRELAALIHDAELDKAEALDGQAALRFRDAQDKARAGLRDEARARIEQGLFLAAEADDARELAGLLYDAELDKADAQHVQAQLRRGLAQQTFQQAGFFREARAAGLRREGHALLFASRVASDRAAFDDRLTASAADRAQLLRQTASVVRRSNPDAALLARAAEMEQQAELDRQEALRLNREAWQLRRDSAAARLKAAVRFQTAEWLDPGGV
jgi:hypothetical protein